MLDHVQDGREVRGMGRGLSDHYVLPCKVRSVCARIKRKEVVNELGGLEVRN